MAIKSTYIFENLLVRHVHIYDQNVSDVQTTHIFPGKHAPGPHCFIMYPKAILPQQLWSHCKVQLELKSPGRRGPFLLIVEGQKTLTLLTGSRCFCSATCHTLIIHMRASIYKFNKNKMVEPTWYIIHCSKYVNT